MAPGFPGFPREAMTLFRGLKRNNRREWFQARKHVYEEQVKAPMCALVEAVNAWLAGVARQYIREPEEAIYRIYRDTRFSADKTPYKTHVAANFPRRGLRKHASASLYFSVSPEELEVAGGVYMPQAEELRAIRMHLLERHEEFRRLAGERALRRLMGEMRGERLTRVPKGFPAEHPAADLVRYKQWLWYVTLDPEIATTAKLLPEIVRRFEVMAPVVEFLNEPLAPRRFTAEALR